MTQEKLLEALRDFYAATNAQELQAAAQQAGQCVGIEIPPNTDWTAVEYEFNRFFVGPTTLLAPPFASAWSEDQRSLMGRATMEVRQVYHALGLAVQQEGSIPDDHLAFELEAVLAMKVMLEGQVGPSDLKTLYAWLVCEHLAHWVPPMLQAVREHAGPGSIVAMVTDILALWLDNERNAITKSR